MSTVVRFGTPTKYINAANFFLYGEGGPFDKSGTVKLEKLGKNELEDRFERGYLGALRLAGAVLATQFSSRKRVPRGNAWELLERYGGQFEHWAEAFSAYVPVHNRLSMGLDVKFGTDDLQAFEHLLAGFSREVNEYLGWTPVPTQMAA